MAGGDICLFVLVLEAFRGNLGGPDSRPLNVMLVEGDFLTVATFSSMDPIVCVKERDGVLLLETGGVGSLESLTRSCIAGEGGNGVAAAFAVVSIEPKGYSNTE